MLDITDIPQVDLGSPGPARDALVAELQALIDLANAPAATAGVSSIVGLDGSGTLVRGAAFAANAADYGAPGTTLALANAIAAVAATGGGIVHVPAGIWTVSSTITIPSLVQICGAGRDATIFKAANGLNADLFVTTNTASLWTSNGADGAQYWGISNCSIDGNKANNSAGNGIKSYSRCFVLRDLKVTYCKEWGIATRWGGASASWDDPDALAHDPFMEALISNVFVGYNDHEGIYYDGPHDGRMENVIAALNSHSSSGSYDGIYIGPNAGGLMATMCHSWGETQRYAWNIDASSTHFANCEADDGYTALIKINGSDCTWIGGTQIGGAYATPPSTLDKNLKGFVFGTSAFRPHIVTSVRNCPNGAIDFTNVGNLGGYVHILGALDSALQTANTGQATYGFQGTIPTTFYLNIDIRGAGNGFGVSQLQQATKVQDGSAAFPSLVRSSDNTTGVFFAANKVGFATAGAEVMSVLRDTVKLPVIGGTPTHDTWVAGLMYFDSSLNKARIYDGTAWQNLW